MVVLTSTVDPPVLPATAQQTCMSMARKSALAGGSRGPAGEALDPVRVDVLHEAAQECERYLQRMLFPGAGTGERVCVAVVDVDRGEQDIPACPTLPDASGVDVAITSVEKVGRRRGQLRHGQLRRAAGRSDPRRRTRHLPNHRLVDTRSVDPDMGCDRGRPVVLMARPLPHRGRRAPTVCPCRRAAACSRAARPACYGHTDANGQPDAMAGRRGAYRLRLATMGRRAAPGTAA